MESPITRRSLLRLIATSSAGLLVAACAIAPAPSPSPSPAVLVTDTPIPTLVPARTISAGDTPTNVAAAPTVSLPLPTATQVPATSFPTKTAPGKSAVGLKPGETLPDFTFAGIDGKPITGADLTVQRKPYILFFFATW